MNVNDSDSYRIEIIILCMFVKVYRSVGYYVKQQHNPCTRDQS